jgi:hypothetical protein
VLGFLIRRFIPLYILVSRDPRDAELEGVSLTAQGIESAVEQAY